MKLALTSSGIQASAWMSKTEKLEALRTLVRKTSCPRQATMAAKAASSLADSGTTLDQWELIDNIHIMASNKRSPRICILGGEHKPGRCCARQLELEGVKVEM